MSASAEDDAPQVQRSQRAPGGQGSLSNNQQGKGRRALLLSGGVAAGAFAAGAGASRADVATDTAQARNYEWDPLVACKQSFVDTHEAQKGPTENDCVTQALIVKMLRGKQQRDTTAAIGNGEDVEVRGS